MTKKANKPHVQKGNNDKYHDESAISEIYKFIPGSEANQNLIIIIGQDTEKLGLQKMRDAVGELKEIKKVNVYTYDFNLIPNYRYKESSNALKDLELSIHNSVNSTLPTRVFLEMHGYFIKENNEHNVKMNNNIFYTIKTKLLFKSLTTALDNKPITVFLSSCESTKAIKEYKYLAQGSQLLLEGPENNKGSMVRAMIDAFQNKQYLFDDNDRFNDNFSTLMLAKYKPTEMLFDYHIINQLSVRSLSNELRMLVEEKPTFTLGFKQYVHNEVDRTFGNNDNVFNNIKKAFNAFENGQVDYKNRIFKFIAKEYYDYVDLFYYDQCYPQTLMSLEHI